MLFVRLIGENIRLIWQPGANLCVNARGAIGNVKQSNGFDKDTFRTILISMPPKKHT